jgi:programmed cell death protein 5
MALPGTTDAELEAIRKRKLQELEMQQELRREQEEAAEAQLKMLEEQKQMIMRQILTPEAKERLGRLRMARPELVAAVEQQLIALAQTGRLGQKIDDNALKQILTKLMPTRREIKIMRK